MTGREKLIDLLVEAEKGTTVLLGSSKEEQISQIMEQIADKLIANGVKVVGAETDLFGKCGSCAFAKPVRYCGSNSYVECTNEEHLRRRKKRCAEAKRPRTVRACKNYVPKEE